MRVVLLLLGGSAAVVSLLAACGGNVTHLPGQGGGSASSSGNSTDASSATGNPTSSATGLVSSSSGIPGDLCANFCANRVALMCPGAGDCAMFCPVEMNGPCGFAAGPFFQCLIDFAIDCDIPAACQDELEALQLCSSGGECGPVGCSIGGSSGGQTSCECETTCGMTNLVASCVDVGSDGKCQCFVNGNIVGECAEQSPACDLFGGCCAQFFLQ